MRRASAIGLSLLLALVATGSPALGQQGPNFNRVNTLRREVTVSPGSDAVAQEAANPAASPKEAARSSSRRASARAMPAAGSFSLGNPGPGRPVSPPSVQVRTTPHSFYPGMRAAQGLNRNVPVHKRSRGGVGLMGPGSMGVFPGLPGALPAPGRAHR
jgi:hypothetical protein